MTEPNANMPATGPPSSSVDLDDLAEWIHADRRLTAEIDRLTEARKDVRERIQTRMGDAMEARVAGAPAIRWAWSKPATYIDKKALETDHPEIAAQYSKEKKPARRYVLLDPPETSR